MTAPMDQLMDDLRDLLEDFQSLAPELWHSCEQEAEAAILAGVRRGVVDLSERAAHEDAATRAAYLQRVMGFMKEQDMLADAERIMAATWTEADLANLNDGVLPDRETLDAFRIRCLLVHYGNAADASAARELVGE